MDETGRWRMDGRGRRFEEAQGGLYMAHGVCFVALEAAVWGEARGAMMVRRATGHAGEALVVLEGGWAHAGGVHFRLGGPVIKEAAIVALSSLPRVDVAVP